MKNLNLYGEEFIEKVLDYGRLEDEQVYKQINHIYISESNTNYLINLEIVEHSEKKYIYNGIKYIYNTYKIFFCDEIFAISKRLSEEAKEELINNFCDDMFSTYYNFSYEDISDDEYYSSNDLSRFKIIQKLENKILYNRKFYRG